MKKIDLNFPMKDIEGRESGQLNMTIGNALLARQEKIDPVKYFDWAMKLGKGEILELDSSDFTKFKNAILESDVLIVIQKGAAIKYLESLKDEEKETKK